jgi:hypothetical protein
MSFAQWTRCLQMNCLCQDKSEALGLDESPSAQTSRPNLSPLPRRRPTNPPSKDRTQGPPDAPQGLLSFYRLTMATV